MPGCTALLCWNTLRCFLSCFERASCLLSSAHSDAVLCPLITVPMADVRTTSWLIAEKLSMYPFPAANTTAASLCLCRRQLLLSVAAPNRERSFDDVTAKAVARVRKNIAAGKVGMHSAILDLCLTCPFEQNSRPPPPLAACPCDNSPPDMLHVQDVKARSCASAPFLHLHKKCCLLIRQTLQAALVSSDVCVFSPFSLQGPSRPEMCPHMSMRAAMRAL